MPNIAKNKNKNKKNVISYPFSQKMLLNMTPRKK